MKTTENTLSSAMTSSARQWNEEYCCRCCRLAQLVTKMKKKKKEIMRERERKRQRNLDPRETITTTTTTTTATTSPCDFDSSHTFLSFLFFPFSLSFLFFSLSLSLSLSLFSHVAKNAPHCFTHFTKTDLFNNFVSLSADVNHDWFFLHSLLYCDWPPAVFLQEPLTCTGKIMVNKLF